MSQADQSSSRLRAAAYVRMSTGHQQYSTEHQLEVIREYARQRNWEIVDVYSDEGKSGLHLQGREVLRRLLCAVVAPDRELRPSPRLRCQPVGPVSGCGRKRPL